jgi:phosphoadenosine phosphosulfate reductase
MLIEHTLFGVTDKVKTAVDRLRAFEPPDGYYLAFSGGKDSQTILHLALEAGVRFEAHYHMTTVDPPELVYFIRERYPQVIADRPDTTMWRLIERKKIPPTRLIRYCCEHLKEGYGMGRTVVTGVRWAESARRKQNRALLELNAYSKNRIMLHSDNDEARRLMETCAIKGKHIVNPIIEWRAEDVWEYLNSRNIPHCRLYDEGFSRIGCIACPMSGESGMTRELERWPKYRDAYLRAFDRMLAARRASGLECAQWPDAQAVMDWWIHGSNKKTADMPEQLSLFELEEHDNG